jgi:excisionase family DNA binding protein
VEKMMTPRQVADHLGFHVLTVKRLAREGELPSYRLGKSPRSPLRFRPTDIEEYLKEHKTVVAEQCCDAGEK